MIFVMLLSPITFKGVSNMQNEWWAKIHEFHGSRYLEKFRIQLELIKRIHGEGILDHLE